MTGIILGMTKLDEMVLRAALLVRLHDDDSWDTEGYTPVALIEKALKGTSVTERDFDRKAVLRRLRRRT